MIKLQKIKKRKQFQFNLKEPFNQHRNKSATKFRPRWYYGGIMAFIRRFGMKAHRNWHLREEYTYNFSRFYWGYKDIR